MILIIMKASDQKQQRGHTLNFCTVTLPSLCACVFFTLSTDRASTIILRFSRVASPIRVRVVCSLNYTPL